MQLHDDVFFLVGSLHSRLFAIVRIIASDVADLARFKMCFHNLHLSMGSMCSGANMIRVAQRIFRDAAKSEAGVDYDTDWKWSADIKSDSWTFMQISGETKVFQNATGLSSGRGRTWPAGVDRIVEPVKVVWNGVTCGPLSSKSKHHGKNVRNAGDGTSTQETMDAMVSFAGSPNFNGTLEMALVENIKNFVGFRGCLRSCHGDLNQRMLTCKPVGFQGVHNLFDSQESGTPQTRKRVHLAYMKTTNPIDEERYLHYLAKFKFQTVPLEELLDDPDTVSHDYWLSQPCVSRPRPCGDEDKTLKEVCGLKGVQYPPDLEQPLWQLLRLPQDCIFRGCSRLTAREKKVLFVSLNVLNAAAEFPPEAVLSTAVNDSWNLFYWRHNRVPTLDSQSRIMLLFKRVSSPWVFRAMTVNEGYRIQSKPLAEVLSPYQYVQMSRALPMSKMNDLLGQSFDEATMMTHFIASVMSADRRLDA